MLQLPFTHTFTHTEQPSMHARLPPPRNAKQPTPNRIPEPSVWYLYCHEEGVPNATGFDSLPYATQAISHPSQVSDTHAMAMFHFGLCITNAHNWNSALQNCFRGLGQQKVPPINYCVFFNSMFRFLFRNYPNNEMWHGKTINCYTLWQ